MSPEQLARIGAAYVAARAELAREQAELERAQHRLTLAETEQACIVTAAQQMEPPQWLDPAQVLYGPWSEDAWRASILCRMAVQGDVHQAVHRCSIAHAALAELDIQPDPSAERPLKER